MMVESDRGFLDLSIATDLNLHILPPKKPTTEEQELEMLNRTRVWIICFNIDKSTATQFGKPSTLKEDLCVLSPAQTFVLHWFADLSGTSIVRKSLEWYKSSPYNHQVCYLPVPFSLGVVNRTDWPALTSTTCTSLRTPRYSGSSTNSIKKCSRTLPYRMD